MNDLKAFFTERRIRCLSLYALCKEAGIPTKTLDHWLHGRREIPTKHLEKLIEVLKDFGYNPET